ncbi:hypothetical protein VTO73DRAFT_12769 [Trametes versicolor]
MVKDLNDPEALVAAEALQTKKYLVYLDFEMELPFPNRPWYRYTVLPVAPSLRAEDKAEGYAPDMCVPILPNTSHPRGRTPLRTEPVFPYDNCYHWVQFQTDIRVRARPEKFDQRRAIHLPSDEQVEMGCYWGEDALRMDELQSQWRAATGWQDPDPQPGLSKHEVSFDHWQDQASPSASTSSVDSGSSYSDSYLSDESEDSVHALMGIFAGPNQDVGVLPLVDLWLDLADNLKQEDIPDPLEFLKERDAIVSIVQAARSRAYAALNAPHAGTISNPEMMPAQPREAAVKEVKPRGSTRTFLRVPKLLRKWNEGFKGLTKRLRRFRLLAFRAPFVPV